MEGTNKVVKIFCFSKSAFAKFLVACREGNYRRVYQLKARGRDLNQADAEGITGLMEASSRHLHIVKYLVDEGAIVNLETHYGVTALIIASLNGNLDISRFLCERGANVHAATNDGATALMAASGRGHLDVSMFLCKMGANVNAAKNDGATILIIASGEGHLAIVQYLHEQGADLIARDQDGDTALLYAIKANHIAVAAYLKEACIKELAAYHIRLRSKEHQHQLYSKCLPARLEETKQMIGSFFL